jgi:uncharacterized protein (DUF58 family)
MTVTAAPAPHARKRARASHGSEVLAAIERRLGLTSAGVGLLLLGIGGVVLGRLLDSRGVLLLAYGSGLVMGISWLLGRRTLAIVADRSDLPRRVRPGQAVEAELSLEAKRRISTIIVEEHLDPELGTHVRVPVPLLPAGEKVSHPYTFTPRQRGIYKVGPLRAEWNDPFGLTRRRSVIAEGVDIIVHPVVERVSDRVTSREWEDPPIRPPISKPWPNGFEFYGMREYSHGDDPRRIVWRALAQYDKYLVRESEQGITDRVNLFLDTEADIHSPGHPSETFETAVSATASLASKHLNDGFSVTVDVNSQRLAKLLRGQGKRLPLLDSLAGVNRESVPLTSALDRLLVDSNRSSHNVVVTTALSQKAAGRLRVLLERGTSVLIVLVLWEDTDPFTVHRAGSLGCNVVEIAPGAPLGRVFDHVVGARRR